MNLDLIVEQNVSKQRCCGCNFRIFSSPTIQVIGRWVCHSSTPTEKTRTNQEHKEMGPKRNEEEHGPKHFDQ